MTSTLYNQWVTAKKNNRKLFAVLVDPDKTCIDKLDAVVDQAVHYGVDYFFIGGSHLMDDVMDQTIDFIRAECKIPVILFPGNEYQINRKADGVLFLSLISGRNPEFLIGKHVTAAPILRNTNLEVIPTGYMLIDGGVPTSVSYISNTSPIPSDKSDIAVSTAIAGEMLGLRVLYLDAGSGAKSPVSEEMIRRVGEATNIPLIVGGGIRTPGKIDEVLNAGADLVVIGDSLEKDPDLLGSFRGVFDQHNVILEK